MLADNEARTLIALSETLAHAVLADETASDELKKKARALIDKSWASRAPTRTFDPLANPEPDEGS